MCQTAAAVGIRPQRDLDPLVELLDDVVPGRVVAIDVEPAEERHCGDRAHEAHVRLGEGSRVAAIAVLRVGHRVVGRVEALVDHLERGGERPAKGLQPLLGRPVPRRVEHLRPLTGAHDAAVDHRLQHVTDQMHQRFGTRQAVGLRRSRHQDEFAAVDELTGTLGQEPVPVVRRLLAQALSAGPVTRFG